MRALTVAARARVNVAGAADAAAGAAARAIAAARGASVTKAWAGGVAGSATAYLCPRYLTTSAVARSVDAESDPDFKPRMRTSPDDPAVLKKRVDEVRML